MSDSKKKLVKPAVPTSWTEPTVEQIIGAVRDMHDTLVKVNQGSVKCGFISAAKSPGARKLFESWGYVEVSPNTSPA